MLFFKRRIAVMYRIGAVFGSNFGIWDISKLQGGKPFFSAPTFPEGAHKFRYGTSHPLKKHALLKKQKTLLQLVPNQHRLLRHLLLFTFTHPIQKRCFNPPLQREISPRATERDHHLQRTAPCTRFRLVGGGGCAEVSRCVWERCACVSYRS